ncbi:MAG: ABC transporter substrate-binding protein [Candidatus Tectomicrobia bacterium]|nr:ABC transporter substrate-binding protein [Candidatus Tectomicrobia bacterium]
MRGKRLHRVLSGMLGALALALLVWAPPAQAISGPEVKIGVILPMRGPLSFYGTQLVIALEMVKDRIAKEGGIGGVPAKFIMYDSESKPNEAINAVKRLIERDKVQIILGPFASGECEVAFPVANRAQVPIVSPASAKPGISAANRPWTFRNSLTTDKLYTRLLKKWVEDKKIKTVVILYDQKEALMKIDGTQVLPALLAKHGVKVLDSLAYLSQDVDFSAQVTRVKEIKPDGVVLSSLPEAGGLIMRELGKQNVKLPMLGSIGVTQRSIEIAGSAADGLMTTQTMWVQSPDPIMRDWVQEFLKRQGKDINPTFEAGSMYDTVMITKMIMETSKISNKPEDLQADRAKLRDGWQNLKGYKGISSPSISINADGDGEKATILLEAQGGKFRSLE